MMEGRGGKLSRLFHLGAGTKKAAQLLGRPRVCLQNENETTYLTFCECVPHVGALIFQNFVLFSPFFGAGLCCGRQGGLAVGLVL